MVSPLSDFYTGGEGGSGWDAVMGGQADDESLKSKILRSTAGGLGSLAQPQEATPPQMAVQATPSPAPFIPQNTPLDPMGPQMSRPRNPRLQQAMLEA